VSDLVAQRLRGPTGSQEWPLITHLQLYCNQNNTLTYLDASLAPVASGNVDQAARHVNHCYLKKKGRCSRLSTLHCA
jgi:hypothetical protein